MSYSRAKAFSISNSDDHTRYQHKLSHITAKLSENLFSQISSTFRDSYNQYREFEQIVSTGKKPQRVVKDSLSLSMLKEMPKDKIIDMYMQANQDIEIAMQKITDAKNRNLHMRGQYIKEMQMLREGI